MMSLVRRLAFPLALVATVALSGCSSSEPDDHHPPPGNTGDGGKLSCMTDPRVTQFAAGLKASSADGKFVVEIVNAEPSPPRRGAGEAGMNVWKVKLTRDGQPLAEMPTITTFMPDHGHGSPKSPVMQQNPDGTLTVNTLFFFMAGVWQITFSPTSAREPATFSLCVE